MQFGKLGPRAVRREPGRKTKQPAEPAENRLCLCRRAQAKGIQSGVFGGPHKFEFQHSLQIVGALQGKEREVREGAFMLCAFHE